MLYISNITSGLGNRIKSVVALFRCLDYDPTMGIDNVRVVWRQTVDFNQINHMEAQVEPMHDIFDTPLQTIEEEESERLIEEGKAKIWQTWQWDITTNLDLLYNRMDKRLQLI